MTDEELSEITFLKLQYGPKNVQSGHVSLQSKSGFLLATESLIWYKKPNGKWFSNGKVIMYKGRRLAYNAAYYKEGLRMLFKYAKHNCVPSFQAPGTVIVYLPDVGGIPH